MVKHVAAILAVVLLSGCAIVSGESYHTLGVAEVTQCETYTFREDGLIERCTSIKTDAFSGWEAIMNGAASAVVKIFTLGLL